MIKVLPHFTEAKVSKSGFLNKEDIKKMAWNFVKFTCPATGAFFGQLALGVSPKAAALFALIIFWGILADYLSKLNSASK